MVDENKSFVRIFSDELSRASKDYRNFVVLMTDSSRDFMLENFISENRERSFNMGLMPANAVSAGCGFLVRGKMPIICGISDFLVGDGFSNIYHDICEPNLNVKFVGFEGEISNMSDVEIMRTLPNMRVFVPETGREVVSFFETMINEYGPCYLKLK